MAETEVTSSSQEIFKRGQCFLVCVRDKGMKDVPREMAVDELHMGGKHLIVLAFVAKGLLFIYFS